jgi:polysaccharide export outer membrane protein
MAREKGAARMHSARIQSSPQVAIMLNQIREHGSFRWLRLLCLLVICLASAGELLATGSLRAEDGTNTPARDYTIGPGDVLTVTVADAPEYGGKVRVGDSGTFKVTGVEQPIAAEGKTTTELSGVIRQALMDAKQLRDPQVSVFVDEYHGRTVTVLGSVTKPSVYSLQKRTTVLDAVAAAGGALPNSGGTITVVRGEASAEASNTQIGSVQILDMTLLAKGEGSAQNIEVRNGDVVSVSAAQVVYVVGAVNKPGGFTLTNPVDGLSVIQAIAMAQGLNSIASAHHALIVRQSTSAQGRREIPVDISQILHKHATDVTLAPNDILYIPNSAGKQTLKVMGEVAMSAVNGIAIYGVGYKVGTGY